MTGQLVEVAGEPQRRTRPKDRKRQILDAATPLFADRGFPAVTMAAIADSVGITAAALYRHFPSKSDLLTAVLEDTLEQFPVPGPGDQDSVEQLIDKLSAVAVRHREIGRLWSTQLRYVLPTARRALRGRLRTANHRFADLLALSRPDVDPAVLDLLSLAVQAVCASPGYHAATLPLAEYSDLLTAAALAVCRADVELGAPGVVRANRPDRLHPASRRERLLQAATELFRDGGYHATSMEDIGTRAGVTGPSLYAHFSGKEDLLAAVVQRGTHVLWLDLDAALRDHGAPAAALRCVVDRYVARDVGWMATTTLFTDAALASTSRGQQSEYVGEWVTLLRAARPELGAAQARVLVHSALAAIHDLARVRHAGRRADVESAVVAIAVAVLLDSRLVGTEALSTK